MQYEEALFIHINKFFLAIYYFILICAFTVTHVLVCIRISWTKLAFKFWGGFFKTESPLQVLRKFVQPILQWRSRVFVRGMEQNKKLLAKLKTLLKNYIKFA